MRDKVERIIELNEEIEEIEELIFKLNTGWSSTVLRKLRIFWWEIEVTGFANKNYKLSKPVREIMVTSLYERKHSLNMELEDLLNGGN